MVNLFLHAADGKSTNSFFSPKLLHCCSNTVLLYLLSLQATLYAFIFVGAHCRGLSESVMFASNCNYGFDTYRNDIYCYICLVVCTKFRECYLIRDIVQVIFTFGGGGMSYDGFLLSWFLSILYHHCDLLNTDVWSPELSILAMYFAAKYTLTVIQSNLVLS